MNWLFVKITKGAGIALLVITIEVVLWELGASILFAKATGTPFGVLLWLQATHWWWGANWWVTICLLGSGVIPIPVLAYLSYAGIMLVWQMRRGPRNLTPSPHGGVRTSERGVTDNHGHTDWLPIDQIKDVFPGPDAHHGGIAVGEAYRVDLDPAAKGRFRPRDRSTWGKGGRMPLIIDPCTEGSGHSLVFSGSGSYKSTSAVTTILTWFGSSVILDPSTEAGPMLERALRRQQKDVWHLGVPTNQPDLPHPTGFNVLSWIDINDPEAEIHVHTVVSWIYDPTAATRGSPIGREDPLFTPMGRKLVTCLLAHILWSDLPPELKTLECLAQGMATPEDEMLLMLAGIHATSRSHMARSIAASVMGCRADETFSGVYLNAYNGIGWLSVSAYAGLVSRGDFDPATLMNGKTTVFLNLSLRTLETTPSIARVMVGALLNVVYNDNGRSPSKVLFLLDEAARLGRLKPLETARDAARKYGAVLHLLFQSMGQMTEIWGPDGTRAWTDSASWIGYGAIRAGGAGKDLSEQLGTYGVMAYSEGSNDGSQRPWAAPLGSRSSGTTSNTHEISKRLLTAAQFQQDLRDDEFIVVPSSGMPIRCCRPIYFRRPEIVAQVDANRFSRRT